MVAQACICIDMLRCYSSTGEQCPTLSTLRVRGMESPTMPAIKRELRDEQKQTYVESKKERNVNEKKKRASEERRRSTVRPHEQ